jgi:hypothetical protein
MSQAVGGSRRARGRLPALKPATTQRDRDAPLPAQRVLRLDAMAIPHRRPGTMTGPALRIPGRVPMTRTTIDWLERARTLEPMIQKYRDEAEQSRRMPRPLFESLRDAGFFRLWLPRRFGGPEVDMTTLILVVEELSRLEGATGWNVMIGAEGSAIAAYLPEETARQLIAPRQAVVAAILR